jgi:Tol biopolymer transport system component
MKFLILLFFLIQNIGATDEWPILKGPYLGQKPPGDRVTVFMDGIICTQDNPEMCAGFAEDGKKFYFNRLNNGHWTIFYTSEVAGKWTIPKPMPFSSVYTDRDFTISPDGQRIYFGSNRPLKSGGKPSKSLDIWVTALMENGSWGVPENLGNPVNTHQYGENYPSVAQNGNLYFFSCREDSHGGCDIYMSNWENGQYQVP